MTSEQHPATPAIDASIKMPRHADYGRRAAYDAERRAWGGHWYEQSHTAPCLSRALTEDLFDRAVEWSINNLLPLHWRKRAKRPTLVFTRRSHAYCRGDFSRGEPVVAMSGTAKNGLRISSLLHEIAHWCVVGGKPHGQTWQRVYVALVRQFMTNHDADRLEQEFRANACGTAPKKPRRKRRTFAWAYRLDQDSPWMKISPSKLEMTAHDRSLLTDGWNVKLWAIIQGSWKHVEVRAVQVQRTAT